MSKDVNWCGQALLFGGVLAIIVNAVLTPLLPTELPFGEMAASSVFLLRLSLAALVAFLLILGSAGLYARHRGATGRFGAAAFGLTFSGSIMLFAHEWSQVFFVHPLGVIAPKALEAMDDVSGVNLFDVEPIVTLLAFTLGWVLFAVSMLIAGVMSKAGPLLVIVGMFAIPILGVLISPIPGMVAGNVILSLGWIVLGRELARPENGATFR